MRVYYSIINDGMCVNIISTEHIIMFFIPFYWLLFLNFHNIAAYGIIKRYDHISILYS